MIVLDASVAIAVLDSDDAHHAASVALLTAHLGEPMAMSALTLAEVLVRPAQLGTADQVATRLREIGVTTLPLADDDAVTLARVCAETRLRMPDAVVLHAAESRGATVATADAALAHAARRRGIPVHEA